MQQFNNRHLPSLCQNYVGDTFHRHGRDSLANPLYTLCQHLGSKILYIRGLESSRFSVVSKGITDPLSLSANELTSMLLTRTMYISNFSLNNNQPEALVAKPTKELTLDRTVRRFPCYTCLMSRSLLLQIAGAFQKLLEMDGTRELLK